MYFSLVEVLNLQKILIYLVFKIEMFKLSEFYFWDFFFYFENLFDVGFCFV